MKMFRPQTVMGLYVSVLVTQRVLEAKLAHVTGRREEIYI
jgi:hypothetical protein